MKDELLIVEDELNHLRDLLGLLELAAGGLIPEHCRSVSVGLSQAIASANGLQRRLSHMRQVSPEESV